MTLREKQSIFAFLLISLFKKAEELGFEITLGEAWRSPEEAERLAKLGLGIKSSLHTQRLAIDLNLFKDGHFLTATEDYLLLGQAWESLSLDNINCCWGGRFKKKDGNHFSIEHGGRK